MDNPPASTVKTTTKSLDIVELLADRGPLTLEAVGTEAEMTRSTAHRHLFTLQEHGYVVKTGNEYGLSFKFLTIGGDLQREIPEYQMIKSKVDDLAEQTSERAQFIIREGLERVYVYTETGENPVQTGAHMGRRGTLYASAAGKAILANLPESTRESLVDDFEFEQTGPNTITDRQELRDALAEVREQGYALNIEESTGGVHAMGTCIRGRDGDVIGALSVSGPGTRLRTDRLENEIRESVLAAANELELHIEHA
ncbi:transcriptional regulator, IclR family protein [Halorubrum saccharovorum DSM 1137]|uniref:Transcriptional regulator, IclR family protein n=1 Tax=Halorubrum saccharovorum DSM 1137 TaxID=1227484 RepID=M0E462_9EURY|nr:IclR family transcriptional regulator [Halorubrum saccharovorum]ELZ41843.1 transcriptional regulator, IclR family protein [Halorubrum saccharovorum DSM 1137]